jgi:hypothetical protein
MGTMMLALLMFSLAVFVVSAAETVVALPASIQNADAVDSGDAFLAPSVVGDRTDGTFGYFGMPVIALSAAAVAAVVDAPNQQRKVKSRLASYLMLGAAASVFLLTLSSSSTALVGAGAVEGAPSAEPGAADEGGEPGRGAARVVATPAVQSLVWEAMAKAFQSGAGGFLAGACQVIAFMWLRTAMNYQYKNGGSLGSTLRILWAEGGIRRLYQGIFPWAILQAPLSRFGDTASNAMVLGIRSAVFPNVPLGFATAFGSFCGASWRVVITPIDTCKTTLQTDGAKGWGLLKEKVRRGGITVLWYGWEGNYLANVVGSYPFFFVLNFMSDHVPMVEGLWLGLLRHAFIGAVAATISDVVSNSIRVMKTKKQTSEDANMGYIKAAMEIIASDGFFGFMFRGLDTRIFTNVLQGAFFTVLWRGVFKGA